MGGAGVSAFSSRLRAGAACFGPPRAAAGIGRVVAGGAAGVETDLGAAEGGGAARTGCGAGLGGGTTAGRAGAGRAGAGFGAAVAGAATVKLVRHFGHWIVRPTSNPGSEEN